ncbi:hypothetical protein H072_8413 [Dactylellina haptotyla CBS 200.50]|uniref:PrpF protein n=1 Tax=Dactylellina haptotyla (strain CBS 200.50) TaxID=1284197 RepID=S8A4L2_DACHA|nr:hypothetical protein H072_8413 [Dactylellina haptotyla CBS 200.50]
MAQCPAFLPLTRSTRFAFFKPIPKFQQTRRQLSILDTVSTLTKPTRRGSQNSLPAAYYRGGTSRAIFFRREDLPSDQKQWAPIFLGAIGSPDPLFGRQLDGLGGGISSLSKICVVGKSTHPDADVDYTFAALGVRDDSVDYSSNCGNMSAAVGPFAVDANIVPTEVPTAGTEGVDTTVRIHNTNTGKMIHSTFRVVDGEAEAAGEFSIDGVGGTSSRIQLDFMDPAGSKTGKLFPTGNTTDGIAGVRATLIDAGNPCVFITADELGVDGTLSPEKIDANVDLKKRLEEIRCEAAVKMGIAKDVDNVPGSVPKIGFVSTPTESAKGNVVVRAMSVGQPHKAIPITVALAVAAAAKIPGTIVADNLARKDDSIFVISHAGGVLPVSAKFDSEGHLISASVYGSARRLMEGRVFWK